MGTMAGPVSTTADSLRTNYARIGHAAQEVLPKLLKEILTNKQPQSRLHSDVSKNQFLVKTLRAAEWSMINAARTHGFDNFDITLIYKLVRNLNLVPAPTQGWDFRNDPTPTEITAGDDIERIRRIRNKIIHRGNAKLSDAEMASYFLLFKEIARRLEQCLCKPEDELVNLIVELECCSMDASAENVYLERLENLMTREQDLSKEIKKVHQRVDQVKHNVDTVYENYDKMQQDVHKVQKRVDSMVYPDSMKALLDDWREENKYFVKTPAVEAILQTLKKNHVLCVSGSSGVGKSATIHHIALYLQDATAHQICACYHPSEISEYYRKENPQVFVFDDVCGKHTLLQNDVNQWIKRTASITSVIRSGNIKILATCRSQVFCEPQFKRIKLLTDRYCDLSSDTFSLTNDMKVRIARQYLSKNDVECIKEEINQYEFLPLMFALYKTISKTSSIVDAKAFFKNPFDTYSNEMNELRDAEVKTKFCALFFVIKNNGFLKASVFPDEESPEVRNARKNIFEACGIERGTLRIIIKEQLDSLLNLFLRINPICPGYITIHDKMLDFLCFYFGTHLQVPFIKYVDSKLLYQRTQLRSIIMPTEKFTVLINEENEKYYMERIVNDLSLGRGFEVFCNHQLDNEKLMLKLIEHIKQLDDNIVRRVISSTDELGNSTLFWACFTDRIDLVKMLIQKGPYVDPDHDDLYGNLLMNIAIYSRCELIQLLLDKGANVNMTDKSENSTLTVFLKNIDYDIITFQRIKTDILKLLVSKGANVNSIYDGTSEQKTPLMAACQIGDISLIKLLIEKGADVNPDNDNLLHTPLTAIIDMNTWYSVPDRNKKYEIINLLLDKGANVNAHDKKGDTPLSLACRNGDINLLNFLIEKDANVSSNDENAIISCLKANSKTPDQHQIIELLSVEGKNINYFRKGEKLHLTTSCESCNIRIAELLLQRRANVNTVDMNCNSLLTLVCQAKLDISVTEYSPNPLHINFTELYSSFQYLFHDTCIINLLLDKGASINHMNYSGRSPLISACQRGNIQLVRLLINRGADVNPANGDRNQTLLTTAVERKLFDEFFSIRKAKNIITLDYYMIRYGDSPLTIACRKGYINLIRLLLENGADVNHVGKEGQSALTRACQRRGFNLDMPLNQKGADLNHANKNRNQTCDIDDYCECNDDKELLEIVEILLEKGANINTVDRYGQSPLTISCEQGAFKLTSLLIEKGAHVNPENEGLSQTPLTAAVRVFKYRKCFTIVKLLLEKGANVNTVDGYGQSPLLITCEQGSFKLTSLLIEKGADVNPDHGGFRKNLLITACIGANGNSYYYKDDYYINGFFQVVKILLEKGANVNTVDRDGQSPLTIACKQGDFKLTRLLIEKGADVNPDNEGLRQTPLTEVCINYDYDDKYDNYDEHFKVVNFLLEKGSTINTVDRDGYSPLTIACEEGAFKLTRLLVEKGADVNPDNEGLRHTPLTAACSKYCYYIDRYLYGYDSDKHFQVVKFLLEKGSTINMVDRDGQSPLTIACKHGAFKLTRLLIEKGADVNPDNEGLRQTPLTAACKEYHYNNDDDYDGHFKFVKILLKHGATVNTIDEEGKSPFSVAYNSCNVKLIIFLKDNGAIVTSKYTALENMFLIENNVKSVDNLSLNQLKAFQNLLEREVRSKTK